MYASSISGLRVPIVYLNHDLCPECGNISLPRQHGCCSGELAVVCVECGAAVEIGAVELPPAA